MDYFHRGSSTGHGDGHRVRTLSCAEQYRSMSFAQLTYRESLRDIETCLSATHRNSITWASASRFGARRWPMPSERRDWRIHAVGVGPAADHPGEDAVRRRRTGVGPDQYRYDGWTRRPSLCARRSFRGRLPHHQGGGEDAHAAGDEAGQRFRVLSTSRMAAARRSCPDMLLPEAGAIYVVDPGYVDFARLYVLHQAGAFYRHACQVEHRCSSRLFGADGSLAASAATRPSPWTASTSSGLRANFCGASASRTPSPARRYGLHHQQLLASGRHHLRALQKPLAGGTLLQVDQAASSDQAVLRHVGERD